MARGKRFCLGSEWPCIEIGSERVDTLVRSKK